MLDRFLQFLAHDLTKDQVNAVVKTGWRVGIGGYILWACGGLSMFGMPGFARADEISGLKGQVAQLSAKFDTDQAQEKVAALELRVRVLDQEIFEIQARLTEVVALGQRADALYERRLVELKSDKAATERQLALALAHPALNPKSGS